jgi:hypothetical protein
MQASQSEWTRISVNCGNRAPHSAQLLVVDRKTEGLHEVQARTGVGAQPDHVARVGRDFRAKENDVEHQALRVSGVRAMAHTSTRTAPARFNARAAASAVAPVVTTSSMRAT